MGQMEGRNAQYAVVQARWVGRPAECFAITYDDEEALRAILAGSSILACGIASREQALAVARDTLSIACGTNYLPDTEVCESAKPRHNRPGTTKERGKRAFSLERTLNGMNDLSRRVIAAAILFTCSRNVVCGLLRAFIGV